MESVRSCEPVWKIFNLRSERSKEEKRALRQLLTLRWEPLCAELLLSIVIMYLYNTVKWRDLFHIHLHKGALYCLGLSTDTHTHTDTLKYTNADEIIKQGPPIATRDPSAHPALTVDSPPHLSLVIAKKQGTICHSVCKCDHPLCHLKHTHTGVDAHLHEQPYACTQTHRRTHECDRHSFPVVVKDNDKLQFPSANGSQMMKVSVFFLWFLMCSVDVIREASLALPLSSLFLSIMQSVPAPSLLPPL